MDTTINQRVPSL